MTDTWAVLYVETISMHALIDRIKYNVTVALQENSPNQINISILPR